MAVLTDFEPLRVETIDTIRARVDANVNAGLDAADARWLDTTPGHWWWDHTQTFGLELEELYDYISLELPASFFLPFSWGIYLDYWGEMLEVPRNQPVAATGVVKFTNPTAADVPVPSGTEVQVPPTDPDADPLAYTTQVAVVVPAAGNIDAAVLANGTGAIFNVAAHAISFVTVSGITVDNAAAISGGADEELDEPYKTRLLLEFNGTRGGGTPDDYIAETLKHFPSVGSVVVQRAWAGPNSVRLIVADHQQLPLPALVVAIQDYWNLHAPIGSTVTVATVTALAVTVAADVKLLAGYSLDGAGGTQPIRAELNLALADMFHRLGAGDDVQHNRAIAALLAVQGVYDVPALTLDSGGGPVAGDIVVAPLETATFAGGVAAYTVVP